jgi:iron-sulfur cluster assembly accessory protein
MTITVTPNAAEEVKKFMEEQGAADTAGLRVAVLPGGCSGFQYGLNIEDEPQDDDDIVDLSGCASSSIPSAASTWKGWRSTT